MSKDKLEKEMDGAKELKVIGAGLSRTGTLSTRYTCLVQKKTENCGCIAITVHLRAALEELLGGACYHGVVPVVERVTLSPVINYHTLSHLS